MADVLAGCTSHAPAELSIPASVQAETAKGSAHALLAWVRSQGLQRPCGAHLIPANATTNRSVGSPFNANPLRCMPTARLAMAPPCKAEGARGGAKQV